MARPHRDADVRHHHQGWRSFMIRMRVILEMDDWPMWLGEVEGDPGALLRLAGDDVLKVWPVGM
jgi:hypothetical protein